MESVVNSTDRTELYQNHGTARRLPTETERTRPWYPMGAAMNSIPMNINSKTRNRILKADD